MKPSGPTTTSGFSYLRWVQITWLSVLPVLALGPVLFRAGYLLTFDMVWVPQLSMRPSFLGLGSGWPRAVPSDAVVAILDNLLPAMIIQKALLYGALAAAGLGVAAVLPHGNRKDMAAATVGATFYVWNPFVAERLVLGHWPVLLGHAALPWVLWCVRRIRERRSGWGQLAGWLWLGSLSASAGLVTAAVAILALCRRRSRRTQLLVLVMVLAANSVWIIAGLMHWGLSIDAAGFNAFAAREEAGLPAPLATLALGGIWNQSVVPGSRDGVLVWLSLLLLQVPMLLAARVWWRQTETWLRRTLVVAALLAWLIALLGWLLPSGLATLTHAFPPISLLRDGSRYLAPLALLEACLLATAVGWMLERMRELRLVVVGFALLLPLFVMPDLAWGRMGSLLPVNYPKSYAQARATVLQQQVAASDRTLILPFVSYRAPAWNRHWPVLDPMGRYLPTEYVANDALQVSGKPIRGEDPLAAAVAEQLALKDPRSRAEGISELGIKLVVSDLDAGIPADQVTGRVLLESPAVRVQELAEGPDEGTTSPRPGSVVLLLTGWVAFAALAATPGVAGLLWLWRGFRSTNR